MNYQRSLVNICMYMYSDIQTSLYQFYLYHYTKIKVQRNARIFVYSFSEKLVKFFSTEFRYSNDIIRIEL